MEWQVKKTVHWVAFVMLFVGTLTDTLCTQNQLAELALFITVDDLMPLVSQSLAKDPGQEECEKLLKQGLTNHPGVSGRIYKPAQCYPFPYTEWESEPS